MCRFPLYNAHRSHYLGRLLSGGNDDDYGLRVLLGVRELNVLIIYLVMYVKASSLGPSR